MASSNSIAHQHRRNVERLLGAVLGEELDFLCAPKLDPRKPDPRPRFQVSGFFPLGTAFDQGRRSGEVESDLSRRPGDHALVRDFAGQDSDVATLLNHVQRTVGKAELRGDLRIDLQKTADQARDSELSQINNGRIQTQAAAQRRLIFAQALVRLLGVSQHGLCVRQQTLSRLRQAHPMGIAPQQRRAAV
jgi:hypothetical protein